MNEENVVKRVSKRKIVNVNIKISPHASAWLKEKNFSPTGILNEGMKDLGYKEA
jgi:hypothetical protein